MLMVSPGKYDTCPGCGAIRKRGRLKHLGFACPVWMTERTKALDERKATR